MARPSNVASLNENQLKKMNELLDERQREVIIRRIGFGYDKPQTLATIAKHFRITRERVRQIQNEALVVLGDPDITHKILLGKYLRAHLRKGVKVSRFFNGSRRVSLSTVKPRTMEEIKQVNASAYNPWSDTEDNELLGEIAIGKSIQSIASKHGRTRGAITSRLKKLNP